MQGVLDSGRHPWLSWPDVSAGRPALEDPLRGRARRSLLVCRRVPAPGIGRNAAHAGPGGHPGTQPRGLRRVAPGQEVGGAERRRGPFPHRPRALRRGAHRLRDAPFAVGPRGPRGPTPRRLRLRREHEASRPGRGAPLRARRGRPRRGRGRRGASVPGVPPPREGPGRLPRARGGRRAGAAAGARGQTEEGRAGQAVGGRRPSCRAAARPRRPARGRSGARNGRRRHAPLRRRAGGRGEALPGPSHPRAGRRHRARHDRGAQRPRGHPRAADRDGPRARALAARHAQGAACLRQRAPLPAVGLRPRSTGRAPAHERRGREDARATKHPSSSTRWST